MTIFLAVDDSRKTSTLGLSEEEYLRGLLKIYFIMLGFQGGFKSWHGELYIQAMFHVHGFLSLEIWSIGPV